MGTTPCRVAGQEERRRIVALIFPVDFRAWHFTDPHVLVDTSHVTEDPSMGFSTSVGDISYSLNTSATITRILFGGEMPDVVAYHPMVFSIAFECSLLHTVA